ncbi:cytochrome c [Aurantimonas sp. A2-1-M11]|uniref:c-type cytochrome n=1 Tax=Aurantimonas sp. A2-1-M11 TaxID=3113712 RepID=UPI002F929611
MTRFGHLRQRLRQVALLAAALAMMPTTAMAQDLANIANGQRFLEANCARCHSIGRKGVSPHPQAPAFRTLSRNYPIAALEESLVEGLWTGHPDMPEFIFGPGQAQSIIAYIESIQE